MEVLSGVEGRLNAGFDDDLHVGVHERNEVRLPQLAAASALVDEVRAPWRLLKRSQLSSERFDVLRRDVHELVSNGAAARADR